LENLYFIALIPKKELRQQITAIKQDFANRFNSKVALKVYPHITLKAPFKEPYSMHQKVISWFTGLQINQQPFVIELKDFDTFPNKRNPVVYIKPIATRELLLLQIKIIVSFIENISNIVDKSDIEFKPHLRLHIEILHQRCLQKLGRNMNIRNSMHCLKLMHSIYCNMIQRNGILFQPLIFHTKLSVFNV
jgi:2'-5' RNA ligase